MTEFETKKLLRLKKEKDALILAHYYTNDSVQEIADYVGDSYYLNKIAAKASQKTILFCGVTFMAESAKIINPKKTILIPDLNSKCPMASMTTINNILKIKSQYKDLAVVCYINSTSKIKALSDVCVTSSNAVSIVKSLPEQNIYFIPDANLGNYVAKQVAEKNIILNNGFCHVHTSISEKDLLKTKIIHPEALVLVHPECSKEVVAMGDYIGSTSEIINFAKKSTAKKFIVCTEMGILYKLSKSCPDKKFYLVHNNQICPDMKLITLQKVIKALENMEPIVKIDKDLLEKANLPLKNMHQLSYT